MRPPYFTNFVLFSVFVTVSGLPDPGASPEPKIEMCVIVTEAAVSAVRGGPAPEQCNRTVEVYEDVRSPPPVGALWGRPLTCVYRFRAFRASPKDWVLRIRFKKFKVGELLNGTTCHKGYMQIIDGNAKTDVSNRKEGGLFCGETEQPQTFISETSVVKIIFHADNYTDQTYFSFDSRAEQQFEVYLRYGQHPELYPNRRGEVVAGSYCERVFRDCRLQTCYVQSAAYPGIYPRNLHCRYHLNTRLPYIKLYIENEEFNVDGQRCENIISCPMRPITSGAENCPYDYIRIYDGKDESAEVIGTFCGMGKFPYSIIGTSQDLFVEFISSPAGPLLNTGFHFNVGNWPGHVEAAGERVGNCDWLLTAEGLARASASEGIFLSVAHWYPPHTACTYHMKGPPNHLVRLYFPSFRVNRIDSPIEPYSGECGESLTLYDGSYADDSKIIKTFCDTFSRPMEKHDFVSTGSDMFVRFESKTGSYSGSSLYYWAHYDFFNDTRLGERVPDTACDEIIGAWKSRAGWLRSPLNTLVYKTGGARDVHCMTRLVTDTRLYARVLLRVKSIGFKEHPYAASRCGVGAACWEERTDKLLIWEPGPTNASAHEVVRGTLGHCLCSRHTPALPLHVLSAGTEVRILLIVEGTHSAASYFKQPVPLWQGEYEFVHGPLCGKAHVGGAEGALVYPALAALAYAPPPPTEHCAWDMRPEPNADLYLRFDRLHFASSRCHEAQIQVFVGGSVTPELTICGDNATLGKEVRPLSARELVLPPHALPSSAPVRIVLKSSLSPAPVAFRLVWSALYHLPRPEDAQPLIAAETETWHRGFVVAGILLAACVVVILFRKRSLDAPKKQSQ